jgi:hypothetical protein
MSSVIAVPELMAVAATDLSTIGSTLSAAHLAAATPTLALMPAAADEVSASIAQLFSTHAQDYQGLAAQAAAFHERFVQGLIGSGGSYASAEAANTAAFEPWTAIPALLTSLFTPVITLLNGAIRQVQNLIAGFLDLLASAFYNFFFAPIINPILDAIVQAIIKAIIGAFTGGSSAT